MESADCSGAMELSTPPELLAEWWRQRQAWEDKLSELAKGNPMEALGALLVGGSLLFLAAERAVNPKVNSFWDALYFISTCASVGYADIVARTDMGKAVAAVVMTFGPALCAQVLDRPGNSQPAPGLQPVVDKLEAILSELRKLTG
ncbi:MAG: two pore domain potassium channel family protein [Armatimonadetes bacterium]|nr:two pore domain potassium channel family protein [Armatimonadota bacterium]